MREGKEMLDGTTIFKERLKQAVFESGKSHEKIRRELMTSKRGLYEWMEGTRMPNTYYLIKLCRCLNVSADWMLGLSEKKERG